MLYIISDEMIPETHSHGNAGWVLRDAGDGLFTWIKQI